jgi:uncharacterized protein (TIGR03437 family)
MGVIGDHEWISGIIETGCWDAGYRRMLRAFSLVLLAAAAQAQPVTLTYPGISTVRPSGSGGRVSWSRVLNLIAYDRVSPDGYYDIHTMNPDGSNDQCLTCGRSDLPPGHKGDPDFDFSGKWIIFQVEKPGTSSLFDTLASPGSGLFNDVWIMDVAGTQFYQLTDVPSKNSGVLHPHFSHSGNQITWAQMLSPDPLPLGTWEVQIADLVFTGGVPSLKNIQSYQPGGNPGFYETHGFSADDQSVYFSGNPDPGQEWYGLDIYRFTPSTQALVNLTNTPNDWDEHADLSPDGTKILWGSSTGIQIVSGSSKLDYWIMDADGSNKRRLTWFNEPSFPEYQTSPVAPATSAWSPDGTQFLGYIVTNNSGTSGPIADIDLVAPGVAVSAASFQQLPMAPASIISFFSRNLSATQAGATTLPLPDTLGATTIKISDSSGAQYPVPMYFVSPGMVNCYLPDQLASGSANMSVYRDGFLVASGTLMIQPVAPSIFTANASGSGVPAATYVQVIGGTTTATSYAFQCTGGIGTCAAAPISLSTPNSQTYVTLYGTGLRNRSSLNGVVATAGGKTLSVQYAGAQGPDAGLDQINLLIPNSLAGSGLVTISLTVDGKTANSVQLLFH